MFIINLQIYFYAKLLGPQILHILSFFRLEDICIYIMRYLTDDTHNLDTQPERHHTQES